MTGFLVIVFMLLLIIVMLIALAVFQIKMAGMNVKDFWSFIKANETLDKLYAFSKKYEKLTTNEKILKAHEETVKKLKKELTYLEKQSKINIMNKSENCVKELTNKRIQINKAERDLKQKENIVNDIKKSYQEKINEANKLKEIMQE